MVPVLFPHSAEILHAVATASSPCGADKGEGEQCMARAQRNLVCFQSAPHPDTNMLVEPREGDLAAV